MKTFASNHIRVSILLMLGLGVASALPGFTFAKLQSSVATKTANKTHKPNTVPGEIITRFRKDVNGSRAATQQVLTARDGAQIEMRVERLAAASDIVEGLRLVRVAPQQTTNAIEALCSRADVVYAEPNFVRSALKVPNDPRYPQMWGLKNTGQASTSSGNPGTPGNDVHAEPAWDITTGSKDVVVGVVDEGIDINHEDLRDNIWVNVGEIPANGIDDDGNGYVDDVNGWDFAHNDNTVFDFSGPTYPPAPDFAGDIDDHGTHVAGTIGAEGNNGIGVVGVNWQVSLMSLKFLTGPDGLGSTADLLTALAYAKQMRALWISSGGTKGANIRVLNNSYGGSGFSQAELEAIRALGDDGILFVVAAGNEGQNNDMFPTYPASYRTSNIVSVAASTGGGQRANFSNFGAGTVSMTAPGQYILSTTPKNTYDFFSGTSMATPHVAGGAALVCAAFPNISLQKLRSLILYTGYVAPWQGAYVYSIATGRSLDTNAALQGSASTDTIAPGAVTQFRFTTSSFPTYDLQWVAPGDDGNEGKVAAYEVRFADTELTDPLQFDIATPLPGPIPDVAGTFTSDHVQLPWRHVSGFIGVRAVDDVGNKGPIASLPITLDAGVGDPYVVSEGAPASLSTGGTPLGLNADDEYRNYSLPFAFKFYDGTWSNVSLSSNGALYLGFAPSSSDGFSSTGLLNGYRMIAGAWDDLRTDRRAGDDVYVVKPDENRIIFRWQAVTYDTQLAPGLSRGENPVNFEIELNNNGTIITRYGDGNQELFPVVGIGGGWPEPYVIGSHTSEEALKDLTNAGMVTYTLRNPPPPPTANLMLSVVSGPNPVATGFQETYTFQVYNDGPFAATNTVFTDQLPLGLNFVSCTTSQGTCSTPAVGTNGTVSVNIGQLNRFITTYITIVGQVTAPGGTTITNAANVSSARFDNNLTNNSVSASSLVVNIGAFGGLTAVSSSYFSSLALQSDGTVLGWGRNDHMVLGNGYIFGNTANPGKAQNVSNATAISTGGTHSLALKSDGTVWGWGSNNYGESGGPTPYPSGATIVNGLTNIVVVAAGYSHSMALRNDGTVWAWGGNDSGELGLGSVGGLHHSPVQIPGLTNVSSIAASTGYSVAVRTDGTVWTWGENINGQLGDAGGARSTPAQVSGVSGVKAVAAGYNHVLALKTDGTVVGWGMNAFGQSGPSNLVNVNPTPAQIPNLSAVTEVAAGYGFSLARTSDGKVWGWGLNSLGQLGTGAQASDPQPIPSQVSGITNAISIAAGNSNGHALLSDATLVSWGDNTYAQLGDGTTFMRLTPVPVVGIQVVASPTLSPSSATGPGPILVTVNCSTTDAVLHYSISGPDPTENDPIVARGGVITFTQSGLLKVKGFKSGWATSPQAVGFYTILSNPIDDTSIFVRQHYLDFLGREPDAAGLAFWKAGIEVCGADEGCRAVKRIDTSAAFFLSIEFQETGYLVHRFYKASFDRRPLRSEFLPDTQALGNGVVVNMPGWQQQLENNKQAFASSWIGRASFKTIYDALSNTQYVETLIANTDATFSQLDREELINALNDGTTTRAQVLRDIAENRAFYNSEYNSAFVEMQYFGYLRRNPQDAPDNNLNGFNFWLNKLNEFGGDYRRAEMVKAFLDSIEYRNRFIP